MANGIIARQVDAAALRTNAAAGFFPCYMGMAPIWQVDREDWRDLAGKVLLAGSMAAVRESIGYMEPESGAWPKEASLSMVAYYHANIEKLFPAILIVNSGTVPVKAAETTATVTFVKGQATIETPYAVLSSLTLKVGDEAKAKGTDYTVAYSEDGRSVVITAITEMASASVTYGEVEAGSIVFSADTYKMMDFVGQECGNVPSTIAAPGWENETDSGGVKVGTRIASICEGVVDKHWFVTGFTQVAAGGRQEAIAAKESYTSPKVKACWPWVRIGSYIFPVSLVFSAKKQKVDSENDGVPYESASNEHVEITGLCDASGNAIKQLELEADELCENGIATMAFTTAMEWRTWGVCMANYSEADRGNIPPNKLNDAAVQMMDYVCNIFELRYGDKVHKPMSIREVNDILNNFTAVVRELVSTGRLIAGAIAFEPSENSTADIADGQFTYTITETNVPPAKAIIGVVSYDAEALNGYFE